MPSGISDFDVIIIGGGLVGSAIAYGLAKERRKVLVLDQGDTAYRAARGNFGLVWLQGKGATKPEYALWTRRSIDLWDALAEELIRECGADPQYSRPGGIYFCFSEEEFAERDALMAGIRAVVGPEFRYEMLDRTALLKMTPDIGPEVIGASYSPHDGHANPLTTLKALHQGMQRLGGVYSPDNATLAVRHRSLVFEVDAERGRYTAEKVVLAAGNGTQRIAPMLGLTATIRPQRGQILVTSKVKPFLAMPTHTLRQTSDGGVLIGDSKEEVGLDDSTTPRVIGAIAQKAVATFPLLRDVRVVRSWGALRVMTPDGYPIYQQSQTCPGAFMACVHIAA